MRTSTKVNNANEHGAGDLRPLVVVTTSFAVLNNLTIWDALRYLEVQLLSGQISSKDFP
jgi:hypothetical protein